MNKWLLIGLGFSLLGYAFGQAGPQERGVRESFVRRVLWGDFAPGEYELKDLPEGLRAIDLNFRGRPSNYSFDSAFMFGIGNLGLELLKTYWTTGQTVTDDSGASFLLVYSPEVQRLNARVNLPGAVASQETPEHLSFRLELVRTSSIQSTVPRPDLTKDKLLILMAGGDPANSFFQSSDEFRSPVDAGRAAPPRPAWSASLAAEKNIVEIGQATLTLLAQHGPKRQGPLSRASLLQLLKSDRLPSSLWQTLNPNGGSLEFNSLLSGQTLSDLTNKANVNRANVIVWYDTNAWPEGTHLVFCANGYARWLKKGPWMKARVSLRRLAKLSAR